MNAEQYRDLGYTNGDKLPNGAIFRFRDVSSTNTDPDNAHPKECEIGGVLYHFEDRKYSAIEWAPSSKV